MTQPGGGDPCQAARFGTTPGTAGPGGHRGQLLPDRRQTYLALLPNAELEVLGNAGHYPMFETPVALATAMEEFLRRE